MDTLEPMEMYCLRCRAMRVIESPQPKYTDGIRGRRLQVQGKCPECGVVTSKFIRVPSDSDPLLPLTDAIEAPPEVTVMSQEESRPSPTLTITDTSLWRGSCKKCREERSIEEKEYVGMRWDGKRVIIGRCLTCHFTQVVVGVQEEEEIAV